MIIDNWYNFIKKAQIWQTPSLDENTLFNDLKALHELEYKYNNIKSKPFRGLEQRKINILQKIEQKIEYLISKIKPVLLSILKGWLDNHALLDPNLWAKQRLKELESIYYDDLSDISEHDFKNIINDFVSQFYQFLDPNYPYTRSRQKENMEREIHQYISKKLSQNPQQFESLHDLMKLWANEYKDGLIEDIDYEDLEYINERYDKNFQTKEQAKKYIEESEPEELDLDIDYFIDNFGFEELANLVYNNDIYIDFLYELYENILFPLWSEHWTEQGIEEVRDNVENMYENLKNASNITENIIWISLSLNAMHMSGNIISDYSIDHLDENTYDIYDDTDISQEDLTNLSNLDVSEWNQQLKEIGVDV